MQTYRYYCLDGVGRIHNAEWFEAESDELAVEIVQSRHLDGRCEVWRGSHLIGSTSPAQMQQRG